MNGVSFDPIGILATLHSHDVEFIVIGGIAGRVLGSPTMTNDLDICYARDNQNRVRLAAALKELGAQLRGAPPGLPFVLDEQTIAFGDSFTFDTTLGSLDCLGTPSGTRGYADLAANAHTQEFVDGVKTRLCSLDDLMRMKKAASRPKDLIELEVLSALREEIERSDDEKS